MRQNPTYPTAATGFVGRLAAHRFGLAMLICALVFAGELMFMYGTVGLPSVWARFTVASAP